MTNLPVVTLASPVPGDTSTFQSYRQAGDPDAPPDASFGSAAARYAWFYNRMLPAWQVWRATHGAIDLQKLLNGGYKERP